MNLGILIPQAIKDLYDGRKFGGFVDVEVIRDGPDGPKVIKHVRTHNLVVNTGKRQTWRQAAGLNTNIWDQMRIGTSGVAANSGQTNVVSPITTAGGGESLITVDSRTLLSGTRTFQIVNSYPSGGGSISAANIQEVSVLNQNTAPGGSALMRAIFTSVNKTEADKLKITYNVRIT